jgi:hypothetical protein
MEKQDENYILFKKTSFKLSLVIIFGSLISLSAFMIIQHIGWPDTVKWFFTAFIWIFSALTGTFHIIERMQMERSTI